VILSGLMIVTVATGGIKNIKPTSPTGWLAEFLYLSDVLYLVILLWLFLSGPWFSVDHLVCPKLAFGGAARKSGISANE